MQSPELFVGVITLLVAILGAAFAFRQIGRADRDRRERLERQEDEDILEWARINRRDATVPMLTRAAPIPDEWRTEFRRQRSEGRSKRS